MFQVLVVCKFTETIVNKRVKDTVSFRLNFGEEDGCINEKEVDFVDTMNL